jgi:predicted metal-dependent enzyme (double-stranded beta helix superfamily)
MSDEYYANSPIMRSFIEQVLGIVATKPDADARIEGIRPAFAALLAEPTWLPPEFAVPCTDSRMGGGIGSYLLYRRENRSLTLHALVVPPKAETPIHDHLAWGLVGLFRGEQEEEVFRRLDDSRAHGKAVLKLLETRRIKPGQFYALLPPEGDIHRVRTISVVPSVSIHLLGNDLGCIWRHSFDPAHETVHDFRSGYVNVECND